MHTKTNNTCIKNIVKYAFENLKFEAQVRTNVSYLLPRQIKCSSFYGIHRNCAVLIYYKKCATFYFSLLLKYNAQFLS